MVAESRSDGPAAQAGIEPGDIITAVNSETVKDACGLRYFDEIGGVRTERQNNGVMANFYGEEPPVTVGLVASKNSKPKRLPWFAGGDFLL